MRFVKWFLGKRSLKIMVPDFRKLWWKTVQDKEVTMGMMLPLPFKNSDCLDAELDTEI